MDEARLTNLLNFFVKNEQPSGTNLQPSESPKQTKQKEFAHKNQSVNKQGREGKAFAEEYFSYVGLIQSLWFDKKSTISRTQKCLYGTAFLIRPKIVLTCTHNVYDIRQKRRADKVKFIPGQNGYNISQGIVYQCNYFKFLPLEEHISLEFQPTINDLCILRIEKQLELLYELPMEVCHPLPRQNLTMIAYPNKDYRHIAHNLLAICLDRRHEFGKVVAIKQDIISYEIATQPGCSGSPIFARREGRIYLVGMHSHNGGNNNKYNQGLFFNTRIWVIVKLLMQQIENQYKMSIEIDSQVINTEQSDNYHQMITEFDQYFVFKKIVPTMQSSL